jgi:hypothetical protein
MKPPDTVVGDGEIERIADELIREHRRQAARVAAERLNTMIDRHDIQGRDLWACVVRAIHQKQGTGTVEAEDPGEPDR